MRVSAVSAMARNTETSSSTTMTTSIATSLLVMASTTFGAT